MGWQGKDPADLEKTVEEGGIWTGGKYERGVTIVWDEHKS